jgi:alkanesulfonate monooxygenase SsuD/methylene tetrahydromethanopterin reductase-like flavin-dependent oxidoreductase (luciferase family)
MQIGFLADIRNPPPWKRPWPRLYGRTLELIEEAERLGGAAVFLGEHHLTDDGYIPQSLTFAAAIAARTKRIRIGTAILLAPLRHPMHIAEEAAIVDILSGGRLELGLGAGYVPAEFKAFDVERADRFKLLDRAVVEVRRLLADVVSPRPIQERLPIWCGYFGKGARRAGLMGEGLLSIQRACLEPYLEGLAAGGHNPADARMASPLDMIVCDDPERTLAQLKPHIDYQATAYGKFRDEIDRAEGRDPAMTPRDGSASHDSYRVLTPEDAIAHIRKTTHGLPVAYMLPCLSVGGMPDDLVLRHITLTVTKVAPALAGDGYTGRDPSEVM